MAAKKTLIAMAIVGVFAVGTMGMVIAAENDDVGMMTSDGIEESVGKENYPEESHGGLFVAEGSIAIPTRANFVRKAFLASPVYSRKLSDTVNCYEVSCVTEPDADWCWKNHRCGICDRTFYKCTYDYGYI